MRAFDYKVVAGDALGTALLNELGNVGWELVTVLNPIDSLGNRIAIFKREKERKDG